MAVQLALLVASRYLGEVFRPRPKRITFKEFLQSNAPDETRPIEYHAGTTETTPPRIWFGDYKDRAVERDSHWSDYLFFGVVGAALLDFITVGYRFYIAEVFPLGYGPDTHVEIVKIDDKIMYYAPGAINAGGSFLIDGPQEWGGDQPPGLGGEYSLCDVTRGNYTDPANAYLQQMLGANCPALRGISLLVKRGPSGFTESGYFAANNPQLREWKVQTRRLPNNLATEFYEVGSGHANPMEVLYEHATSRDYGAGMGAEEINIASLQEAAEVLHGEGIGWSGRIAETSPASVIEDIKQMVGADIYPSPSLGMTVRLIRREWSFASLPILNRSNVTFVERYTPGSLEDSVNKVSIDYRDKENNLAKRPALFIDHANQRKQGHRVVPQSVEYRGLADAETAAILVTRDGRALGRPGPSLRAGVLRSVAKGKWPGEVFRLQWTNPTFEKVVRLVSTKPGPPENPDYEFLLEEDQFSTGLASVGAPAGTGHVDPTAGLGTAPPSAVWDDAVYPPNGLNESFYVFLGGSQGTTILGAIEFGDYDFAQYARVYVTEPGGVETLSPLYLTPDGDNKAQFAWPAVERGTYTFCVQTFNSRGQTNGAKVCESIVASSSSPSASVSPSVSPSASTSPSASASASASPSASVSPSVSPSASLSPSSSASASESGSTSASVSPSASTSPSASASASLSPSASASPSAPPGFPFSRIYLPSTGAAGASPAFSGSWTRSDQADRLACVTTRINSALTTKVCNAASGTAEAFVLWRQYVSAPVTAQTIAGTVKGQLEALESSGILDASLALLIRVVSNDGSTVRGTLLPMAAPDTLTGTIELPAGSVGNRRFRDASENTSITLSSVAAQDGDRLVIEVGYRQQAATSNTSRTATGHFGDDDSNDLPEADDTTNWTYNPWIEFSNAVYFQ